MTVFRGSEFSSCVPAFSSHQYVELKKLQIFWPTIVIIASNEIFQRFSFSMQFTIFHQSPYLQNQKLQILWSTIINSSSNNSQRNSVFPSCLPSFTSFSICRVRNLRHFDQPLRIQLLLKSFRDSLFPPHVPSSIMRIYRIMNFRYFGQSLSMRLLMKSDRNLPIGLGPS